MAAPRWRRPAASPWPTSATALEKARDVQKQGKTTILEVICTMALGDPLRRDALKKPVRPLDAYKDYTVARSLV